MANDLPVLVGCVVVTLREDRERLLLSCADGEIAIEVHPVSMGRVKVVIRAPKSVGVRRQKGEEQ